MVKRTRSASFYHSRQCGIVLTLRSYGIDIHHSLVYDARLQLKVKKKYQCKPGVV